MKIAACVARGGMDDPDCPHDQASRRYWCYLGGDETQEDSTSTTLNLQANITASSALNGLAAQAPQQQLQQAQPAATPSTEAPSTPAAKRPFVAN